MIVLLICDDSIISISFTIITGIVSLCFVVCLGHADFLCRLLPWHLPFVVTSILPSYVLAFLVLKLDCQSFAVLLISFLCYSNQLSLFYLLGGLVPEFSGIFDETLLHLDHLSSFLNFFPSCCFISLNTSSPVIYLVFSF